MTTYENFAEDSHGRRLAAGVSEPSPVGTVRPPWGPIDPAEWNTFWEEFFNAFDDSALATTLAADEKASRRVALTRTDKAAAEGMSLEIAVPALWRVAGSCGAVEDFAFSESELEVQFTTALGARKLVAFVRAVGIPGAQLKFDHVEAAVVAPKDVALPELFVRGLPCEAAGQQVVRAVVPPEIEPYVSATFEAVGSRRTSTYGKGPTAFVVTFESVTAAREALHVVQAPLASQFRLEVSFRP